MSKLSFIKMYGGKSYHAKWIIDHFPKNYLDMDYASLFGGGLNPELQMPSPRKELINDFHYPTYCMYVAMQNGDLYNSVRYMPYAREIFEYYRDIFKPQSVLDYGVAEYVLHRMSRGGMKKEFAWSDRLRGGKPGDVNAWENALSSLPKIQHRFRLSIFRNDDFRVLLKRFGGSPDVFMYLDPPYLLETRTSKKVYDVEFTHKDHEDLLSLLGTAKCKWLLSGYESELYNKTLGGPRVTKSVTLSSSQSKIKRSKIECLWSNY